MPTHFFFFSLSLQHDTTIMYFAFNPKDVFTPSGDRDLQGRAKRRARSGTAYDFPPASVRPTTTDAPPKPYDLSYHCSATLRPTLFVPSLEECITGCKDHGDLIGLHWNASPLGDEAPPQPAAAAAAAAAADAPAGADVSVGADAHVSEGGEGSGAPAGDPPGTQPIADFVSVQTAHTAGFSADIGTFLGLGRLSKAEQTRARAAGHDGTFDTKPVVAASTYVRIKTVAPQYDAFLCLAQLSANRQLTKPRIAVLTNPCIGEATQRTSALSPFLRASANDKDSIVPVCGSFRSIVPPGRPYTDDELHQSASWLTLDGCDLFRLIVVPTPADIPLPPEGDPLRPYVKGEVWLLEALRLRHRIKLCDIPEPRPANFSIMPVCLPLVNHDIPPGAFFDPAKDFGNQLRELRGGRRPHCGIDPAHHWHNHPMVQLFLAHARSVTQLPSRSQRGGSTVFHLDTSHLPAHVVERNDIPHPHSSRLDPIFKEMRKLFEVGLAFATYLRDRGEGEEMLATEQWVEAAGANWPARSAADLAALTPPPGASQQLSKYFSGVHLDDEIADDASAASGTSLTSAPDFGTTPEHPRPSSLRRGASPSAAAQGDSVRRRIQWGDTVDGGHPTTAPAAAVPPVPVRAAASSPFAATPTVGSVFGSNSVTPTPAPALPSPFATAATAFAQAAVPTPVPGRLFSAPATPAWSPAAPPSVASFPGAGHQFRPAVPPATPAASPSTGTDATKPSAIVTAKLMDFCILHDPTASVIGPTGSIIDGKEVLIVASPSSLLQSLVSCPISAVQCRLESAYAGWRSRARGASWCPSLDVEGMSKFLSMPAVQKAVTHGAISFPLTDPPASAMDSSLTVYHFLVFLGACTGPTIPASGVSPLDGIALMNVILFFFSLCFDDPSWIEASVMYQSFRAILDVIEQPQYSDRFRLSRGIDPAIWLQRVLQCLQEILRLIEQWSHPPVQRLAATVGGSPHTIAEPKTLLSELAATIEYYTKTLAGEELGTSTFARGSSPSRPGHLFDQAKEEDTSATGGPPDDPTDNEGKKNTPKRKHARTALWRLASSDLSFDDVIHPILKGIPRIKDKNLCVHFCCKDSKGCLPKNGNRYCNLAHVDVSNLGRFSHEELKPIREWISKNKALIAATEAAKTSLIYVKKDS